MAMSKEAKKAVKDFYGSKVRGGLLHEKMGVPQGKKIPLGKIDSEISKLKAIKNKTPAQLKKLRELVFAKNAKTKFARR